MRDYRFDIRGFEEHFRQKPLDVSGNLIQIGSRVQITRRDGWVEAGDEGVVRVYHDVNSYGVQLDRRGDGHTLEGGLDPPCPDGYGRFFGGELLKVISLPPPVISVDEEAELANILSKVSAGSSAMMFGGKIFNVSTTENVEATALFGAFTTRVAEKMKEIRRAAEVKVEAIRKQMQAQLTMPLVLQEDIVAGLSVYQEGGLLVYAIPFHYSPRFITTEDGKKYNCEVKELSEEHQAALVRKPILLVYVTRDSFVYSIRMKTSLAGGSFNHYHGNETQCWGTMVIPAKIESMADLYRFKAQFEELLTTINYGSTVQSHPIRMPKKEDLLRGAKEINKKVSDLGFVAEIPASPEVKIEGKIEVGSIVKIRPIEPERTHEAFTEVVGSIGKVVSPLGELTWAVEFAYTHINFHDAIHGITGYCFWFREHELELMPPRTRRNTKPLVAREVVEPEPEGTPTTITLTIEHPAWRVT